MLKEEPLKIVKKILKFRKKNVARMYPWRVGCRGLGGGAGEHGVHDRVLARGGQLLGEGRQTHSGQTIFLGLKLFSYFTMIKI